tara:strand:- start:96 stop:971 length:876 start_codon:yes stop_codon:yes gene_type:complete
MEAFNKIKLKNPSIWNIQGYSRYNAKTGFILYPFKITLDCGLFTSFIPNASIITNSSWDHTSCLPDLYTQDNSIKGQEELYGRPVYMPESCIYPIQKLMEASILLDASRKYKTLNDFKKVCLLKGFHPISVKPKQNIKILGFSNLNLEILNAYYNIETIGYGFYTTKRFLKKTFNSLSKEEILNAKHNKLDIDYEIKTFEFVYFCDSTIHNFTLHDEWKKYPVIICGCNSFQNYNSSKYFTHLIELEQILFLNKDKQWIIINLPQCISDSVILKHQNRLRSKNIDVTFVIN